jgi:hypothetical protein
MTGVARCHIGKVLRVRKLGFIKAFVAGGTLDPLHSKVCFVREYNSPFSSGARRNVLRITVAEPAVVVDLILVTRTALIVSTREIVR